MLSFVK